MFFRSLQAPLPAGSFFILIFFTKLYLDNEKLRGGAEFVLLLRLLHALAHCCCCVLLLGAVSGRRCQGVAGQQFR